MIPRPRIEVGFDLTNSDAGDFFKLNDSTRGQLDNTTYTLAGILFIDVTNRVRTFSVSRGRNNDFDNYTAGQVNIEFNNHDRAFDPLYVDGPFYGNIIPRREVRIYSNDISVFRGLIDDWNFSYTPDGDSVASAICSDYLGLIAGQSIGGFTPPSELTGARVERILNLPDVNWPAENRVIDTGASLLSATAIPDNTNALAYLQQVANTEPGDIFINKTGDLVFTDRTKAPTSASLIEFGGTAIGFQNVSVVYGSEDLYNEVVVSRVGGGTAVATDIDSQNAYGIRTLTETDLLFATDNQSVELALVYASRYSQPEYRFDSIEIGLHKIEPAEVDVVLGAELGSICSITFTPNNIGDPITRYVEVIRIDHQVRPEAHFVTLGFQAVDYASIVLDDPEFGKLDTYSLSW